MPSELRLYDRSRVTTDWNCPRKRYWNYEYEGKGIVSGNTHLELYLGTVLHDGLAAIAHDHIAANTDPMIQAITTFGDYEHVNTTRSLLDRFIPRPIDIDRIASTAHKQIVDSLTAQTNGEVDEVNFAFEQAALVEGLLRGFSLSVWPQLMKQYPIILCIEQEMKYEHDGLTFMSKPDLVVEDREGNVWYLEYKSTSSKKEGWVNGWATAVQLHSTIKAIEASIGRPVTGVIVQGLYKGFESYGKQSSPFCYAYHRNGNPPFTQSETLYEYKAGFKRFPVWERPGGVKAWVEGMPANVLGDQFPQVPPIFVNEELVDNFFKQRAYREHEIAGAMELMPFLEPNAKESLMNEVFQQKWESCHPYFGKGCPYLRICHGHVDDPLREGWELRVPHHSAELEQQEQQSDSITVD